MRFADIVLMALYFIVGTVLQLRALAQLRVREKWYSYPPIEPEKYTAIGNKRRIIANRFWLGGGIVLVAVLWILN